MRPHDLAAIPKQVQRATDLAREMGFDRSCSMEVGCLLRVLAGTIRAGTVGEIGTGCGVGLAWMVSSLASETRAFTVESDPTQVRVARDLFASSPNVIVLHGDWHAILAHGPFDLLFADFGAAKRSEPEAVIEAVRSAGMILLDDLTPQEYWPSECREMPDPVREFWLHDPRLAATELRIGPREAVILATRL